MVKVGIPSFVNKNFDNGFYSFNGHENIYLYDTYSLFEKGSNSKSLDYAQGNLSLKSSSFDNCFSKTLTESKTVFGKAFAFLIGWSKKETVKFSNNSKRRLNVRFYAQNFVVYSEAGIGVKTQAKRWIGWSKTKVSELRAGVDYLVLEEKWPNLNDDALQKIKNDLAPYQDPSTGKDLRWIAIVEKNYKSKTYLTIDFANDDLDFPILTEKDVKNYIKKGYNYLKSQFGPTTIKESDIDGITVLSWNSPGKVRTYLADKEQRGYNDDDMTLLLDKEFGFIINLKWTFGAGSFDFTQKYQKVLEGVTPDYEIKKALMWGAAKYSGDWQGIKLKYKY